ILSVYGIAPGPDCNVWFTDISNSVTGPGGEMGNRLGRVELGGCPKPPSPPPAAPTSGTARVAFSSHTVTIDTRTGRGALAMTCQNIAADRCTISLSLKVGKLAARTKLVSIGSAKGTVLGGKRANLKVKL